MNFVKKTDKSHLSESHSSGFLSPHGRYICYYGKAQHVHSLNSLAVNNVESIGSPLRNIAIYSDYVAIITINNLQDIS